MEHVGRLSDQHLDAWMRARGLHCYRAYFMWGKTPAYRSPEKTTYRFVDQGDVLTPAELLARLLDTWQPAAHEEREYAAGQMRTDLEALSAYEDAAQNENA